MNRESWLEQAIVELRPLFKGIRLPKRIHISISWPSGGERSSTVAEAYPKSVSKDRINNIFVNPKIDDPLEVLTALTHELVHVSLDCLNQHGPLYQERARKVGLIAPWIYSVASEELSMALKEILVEMPDYPHAGFRRTSAGYGTPKKNYSLKAYCRTCGYIVRVTKTWVDQGLPKCGKCDKRMELE